jgi:hypothetical protein
MTVSCRNQTVPVPFVFPIIVCAVATFFSLTVLFGVRCAKAEESAALGANPQELNFFIASYIGKRTDFSGNVGYELVPESPLRITALGRAVAGAALQHSHKIALWDVAKKQLLRQVTVTDHSPIDGKGYAIERLSAPILLEQDRHYAITSSEEAGGDPMLDITNVPGHFGVAGILSGVYAQSDAFPAMSYGSIDQGYGLATFMFDATGIDPTLLRTLGTAPRPFVRDLNVGYLLHCNFNALEPYCWNGGLPKLSGWDTDLSGGTYDYSYKKEFDHQWFKLTDTSDKAAVTIKHQIARQTAGELTLEFRFRMPVKMDGVCWQLRDLSQAAISIVTADGNLCWENAQGQPTVLQPYDADHDYGVKIIADLSHRTADVYIDGQLQGHALPFAHAVDSIDFVLIKTGDAATGELFLAPVNIYKGYAVNESFVTGCPGKLPADWTANTTSDSSATMEKFACGPGPDIFSLKLDATNVLDVLATKHFQALPVKTVFECRFLLPEAKDGMSVELGAGDKGVISIGTSHGALSFNPTGSSGSVVLAKAYRANLWYMLKVVADPAKGTADIFLNGKPAATRVAFNSPDRGFDTVKFNASRGVMWVDDVQVYPWQDYPADYMPEPQPCPAQSPYIVGLQSCNLWREGTAYAGWDYVYAIGDRKPYLGWYDEGNPEETDWEIKWEVEHGITFEMHCWYRASHDAVGNPIKDGDMDQSIIKGLFNARYSSYKKFAIMYTNDNGGFTTYDDFCQNIVPYWIEYFFKDPRYFQLDGKPVICLYNYDKLAQDLGGAEKVKTAVQYLRDEAAKAGFPVLIILTERRDDNGGTLEQMQQRKAAGFDALYAYTWFTPRFEDQKAHLLAQRDTAVKAGIDQLPAFGASWDSRPWGGGPIGWASKEEYKKTALWVRDKLMPTEPSGSLGARIVMLDGWNEFGEGHQIMPCDIHGFDYLDVLREVFTAGGTADDLKPTEEQKRRINVLFPRN